ncbi:Uncharacterized protein OBRU01_13096 [Operophtera brumata]|uniref:Uncharacterized protein n=1 Tax=Operophtera brumata TaxID=104452 RepID=A0A0L7L989_OPEBR|nr:Uncharacterized protein OBRU01_13096 [Operophtera brumata]
MLKSNHLHNNSDTNTMDSGWQSGSERTNKLLIKEEMLKSNHLHNNSDTNTMDSGWQSGSERQVTD